jgi:hypothetical protein
MTDVFTEKKQYLSRTVTFHEFRLFYFAPKNRSYQEEELETVISQLFEFIYIFKHTPNKNTVCTVCLLQRDTVDFYDRHEGDTEFA